MKIVPTSLTGVLIIEPRLFADSRGHFLETYQSERYAEAGLPVTFVQDNVSHSQRNVLRGMHYQLGHPQAKLIMVVEGEIFDVAIDVRKGSPSFGEWVGTTLSSDNYRQLYVPPGFAHGFCVLSTAATVLYKCSDYYSPIDERGIRWDDPVLRIDWPTSTPLLSEKDMRYPSLSEINDRDLPRH